MNKKESVEKEEKAKPNLEQLKNLKLCKIGKSLGKGYGDTRV